MEKEALTLAEVIWDYMNIDNHNPPKSDLILCLGSIDTLPAERAAELYNEGKSDLLLFTGKGGRNSEYFRSNKTEARMLADVAMKNDVPESAILLEENSTNTGENVRFSHQMLLDNMVSLDSMIVTHMPSSLRRDYLTLRKQWPEPQTNFFMSSPRVGFIDYHKRGYQGRMTIDDIINDMLGDLQRIKTGADRGFAIPEEIPGHIKGIYHALVDMGYDKQLVRNEKGNILGI